MNDKYNDSTAQRPSGERLIDAAMVPVDLPAFIKQIKEEDAWKNNDRNAITVFKSTQMRIVLIALHPNAELQKHTANGVISVQVLDGKIRFITDAECAELSTGQLITLHERIPHSVLALDESVILLTLATIPGK